METTELLKKVRRIEIKTKSLSNDLFSGSYHSTFKGRGMSFSEVRSYAYGDDVRAIDWNVTARHDTPYIKVFEEERELTVLLLIDISASTIFGSSVQFKKDIITEIAAVLSFSAIQNNDKVGVIFFSDKVEKYIPPKKGKTHILRIIRELIQLEPTSKETNIAEALRFLNNIAKKKSVVFLVSDFMCNSPYDDALKLTKNRHDILGIRIYDERERILPDIGLIHIKDAENGGEIWIDSSSKNVRTQFEKVFDENALKAKNTFLKTGATLTSIEVLENYIKALLKAFKGR